MKHIEVHLLNDSRDVELAGLAGLLLTSYVTSCDICESEISIHQSGCAVVLSDSASAVSCESCLGVAVLRVSV